MPWAFNVIVTSDKDVAIMKTKVESILQDKQAVLYAIVNNAGIADPGDFVFHSTLDIPKKVMDVNYFGQLRVTQALLPLMLTTSREAGGKIFNMSSVCGASASAGNFSYNASKFAVEAWSDSLRVELAPFGIQVVKIRPGRIQTDIQSDWNEGYKRNYSQAPEQIQNLYGGHQFVKSIEKTMASASSSSGNTYNQPQLVVDTMSELLFGNDGDLKPYYWVGSDAKTFWNALYCLPVSVSTMIKSYLAFPPATPTLPPIDAVAHVTIRVRNLTRSLEFYQTLGFATLGPEVGGCQFLEFNPSNNGKWESLVLLKEDKDMPERQACTDGGATRLCMLTKSVEATMAELGKSGIEPIAPMATDKAEKLVAYEDPDGFVVYFVEFGGILGMIVGLQLWWNKRPYPFHFHWSMNVTDHASVLKMLEGVGFKTLSDQNKDQILNGLLPAFKIDPDTTVIDWVRLCISPKGGIVATIMNWISPRTTINAASDTNAMTISVSDVDKALEKAKSLGMYVEEGHEEPSYTQLPIYGNVLIATAYLEKGSCPIHFCCFSNQKP